MISGLKLKILVILLGVGLASATTYWYISSYQTGNDKNTNGETVVGRKLTALEGLTISNSYMESKYEIFNLSSINGPDYSKPASNETGYNDFWIYEYVRNIDSQVIYDYVSIYSNGSVSSSIWIYEKEELQAKALVPDMQGFDVGLLKIDSDEVMEIIKSVAKNESWYYTENKSFELYLDGDYLNDTYNCLTSIWFGSYRIENGADDKIGDGYQLFTINAITGEVLNREL